jgi:hypothetical protein
LPPPPPLGAIARGRELPHDRRSGVRIQPDFAAMHFADAFDDEFGRGLLEHDTGTAQLHGLHEFVLVFRSREDDDAGALVGLLQRLQRREAIQVGHAQIEQQHVRIQFLDPVQNLATVGRFSHDLEVLLQSKEFL